MAELSRLPVAVADVWEWQLDGSCREADSRLFFHPDGERGPARRKRDAAAVAICASCPVMDACRSHGLSVREPYGVWGGLTEDDREEIYRAERISARAVKAAARPTEISAQVSGQITTEVSAVEKAEIVADLTAEIAAEITPAAVSEERSSGAPRLSEELLQELSVEITAA